MQQLEALVVNNHGKSPKDRVVGFPFQMAELYGI